MYFLHLGSKTNFFQKASSTTITIINDYHQPSDQPSLSSTITNKRQQAASPENNNNY
jgi:hypothetical protein